jgi:hypothetical protein
MHYKQGHAFWIEGQSQAARLAGSGLQDAINTEYIDPPP